MAIGAAQQHSIVTLVEGKSGYAVVTMVNPKMSDQFSTAIVKKPKPLASRVKTITNDSGKKFTDHKAVDQSLGSTAYFADPFASWQHVSNENYNDLSRLSNPKKRHLSKVTDAELRMIEDRINHHPRKR
jgi:IS30 family transposase